MKTDDPDEQYLLSDYQRRRVPVRPARKIGEAVAQLLARRGYAQVQSTAAMDDAWRRAVGERFAAQTRCGKVRGGVLEVFAANSAVVQELTFQKSALLKRLTELAPEQKIRDLKFRVGAID
jgi:predicted nucleic acid-binding Zn ribbon protein